MSNPILPVYRPQSGIPLQRVQISVREHPLIAAFPEEAEERIRSLEHTMGVSETQRVQIRAESWWDRTIGDVGAELGLASFPSNVEAACQQVASRFVERMQAWRDNPASFPLFNEAKVGLWSVEHPKDAGDEDAGVKLVFYPTDYYTMCVTREVRRRLSIDMTDRLQNDPTTTLFRNRALNTAVGLNAVLACNGSGAYRGERVLLLTRRAKGLGAYGEHVHVSMNEGMTLHDTLQPVADHAFGFYRGFEEELGLARERFTGLRLFDLALETTQMSFFITALAETEMEFDAIVQLPARDKALEIDGFVQVPIDRRAARRLLDQDPVGVVPHGRFVISSILDRIG